MAALLDVILPVFLLIGFGYGAALAGVFGPERVDGLMAFAQNFAIPCLLFRAISTLDLGRNYDPGLMVSFYAGATVCFALGIFLARILFKRSWEDAVAIGFCCLFSNSLLLGLPITERAYGAGALEANYAIVSVHSIFCYGLGITVMEIVRARGAAGAVKGAGALVVKVISAMFRNALIVGLALGFAVNITGTHVPAALGEALDLMARAALPAALFGLGGVLYRYRPSGSLGAIAMVVAISLLLHPAITLTLGRANALSQTELRSAVLTAAMAPGINGYIFANMYGRAKRVAASAVLIGTAVSIFTVSYWLSIL